MYDGCREGFYVVLCTEVSSYVYLYEDVDVYDGREAGFCVVYVCVTSHQSVCG